MNSRTVPVLPLNPQQQVHAGSYVDFALPMGVVDPSQIVIQGLLSTNIVDRLGNFSVGAVNRELNLHAIRPAVSEQLINRVQVWVGSEQVTDVQDWSQYVNLQRDLTNNYDDLEYSPAYIENHLPLYQNENLFPSVVNQGTEYTDLDNILQENDTAVEEASYIKFSRLPGLLSCKELIDTHKLGRIRVRVWFESANALISQEQTKRAYVKTGGPVYADSPVGAIAIWSKDIEEIESTPAIQPNWDLSESDLTRDYWLDNLRLYARIHEGVGSQEIVYRNVYSTTASITGGNNTMQINIPGDQVEEIAIVPKPTVMVNQYDYRTDRNDFFFRTSPPDAEYSLSFNGRVLIQGLQALDIMNCDTDLFNKIKRSLKHTNRGVYEQGFAIVKDLSGLGMSGGNELQISTRGMDGVNRVIVFQHSLVTLSA